MSRLKTAWKAVTYSGIPRSFVTTASGEGMAISTGFRMGSFAWSSSVEARPSQNCEALKSALSTVGLLRMPFWPFTPSDTGLPSEKPLFGSWHVAQDVLSSNDSRLSLKSFSHHPTRSGVGAALAGTDSFHSTSDTPDGNGDGGGAELCVSGAAWASLTHSNTASDRATPDGVRMVTPPNRQRTTPRESRGARCRNSSFMKTPLSSACSPGDARRSVHLWKPTGSTRQVRC